MYGVSGVGKSTLLKKVKALSSHFVYISPHTNRPLRENEVDKIFVNDEEMQLRIDRGEYLVVNEMYGYRYATPLTLIRETFQQGNIPCLDWPIKQRSVMLDAFGSDVLVEVYLRPPSLEVLQSRLSDGRDTEGIRFQEAVQELQLVEDQMSDMFDLMVVSDDLDQVAQKVISLMV
jgi:guanylate kinase